MALKDLKAREVLLVVTGWAITLLLIMTGTRIYIRGYRAGILFLVLAGALAFVFFRKRKIVLVISSLTWVLVNAGLTALFHPSFWGYTLTIGSAAGLYLIVLWSARRYPYLAYKHMHKVFEGEDAMAAENERIRAEAQELLKRPIGLYGRLIR
jgi:hypothetical protein